MNNKVKKMWVAALRSGKYQQTTEKLCHGNQNGTKYCCLGLLSQLAVNNGVCSRRAAFEGNSVLTEPVMEWAGIHEDTAEVMWEGDEENCGGQESLAALNDTYGLSFKEIAKVIDKNL